MTAVAEKKMKKESQEQNINKPSSYGCEILLEKITLQQAKDPSFPTDAYLVTYISDGKEYLDLCRGGKRVNIFDLYYDRYGSVKNISWGYGKVNPRTWGYKQPEKKKGK
jgi:hypothetical protein